MRNQTIMALALSVGLFSFAQKKEIKLAEKAIKAKNYTDAVEALKPVDALVKTLDDKTKNKFFYLKTVALFADGEGSTKNLGKAANTVKKVKGKEYRKLSSSLKNSITNKLILNANDALQKKNYAKASSSFESVYNLKRKDTSYLYYAATTAYNVPDYKRSLKLYSKLQKMGYTGIETKYAALNKATQKTDEFSSKSARDVALRLGTHIVPTEKVLESKKPDIIEYISLIHIAQGNDAKAIEAIKAFREENPDDVSLVIKEAKLHQKLGHTADFKRLLAKATSMAPNNADIQYNLGVISAEYKDVEAAKAYYSKAIEIDPNHIDSYLDKAVLILAEEAPIIEQMNNLTTSRADNIKYDALKAKRESLLNSIIPMYEKVLSVDPNNLTASTNLMGIYEVLGKKAKFNELKSRLK